MSKKKITIKKPTMKALERKLWKACSDFIRKRDSICQEIKGKCISCNQVCEGKQAQAGHFLPNKACGLITRYHPHNIYLQCFKCNCPRSRSETERVKVIYTLKMVQADINNDTNIALELLEKSFIKVKPTREFYITLTELYNRAVLQDILDFLDSYCYNSHDDD